MDLAWKLHLMLWVLAQRHQHKETENISHFQWCWCYSGWMNIIKKILKGGCTEASVKIWTRNHWCESLECYPLDHRATWETWPWLSVCCGTDRKLSRHHVLHVLKKLIMDNMIDCLVTYWRGLDGWCIDLLIMCCSFQWWEQAKIPRLERLWWLFGYVLRGRW